MGVEVLHEHPAIRSRACTTPRLAGPDVPGRRRRSCGRCSAAILADATRASGTKVRLGATFSAIEDAADGFGSHCIDGSRGRLRSGHRRRRTEVRKTRAAIFPERRRPNTSANASGAPFCRGLPEVDGRDDVDGRTSVKVGVNPVSRDEMYMFVTEDRPTTTSSIPPGSSTMLKALLAPFTATDRQGDPRFAQRKLAHRLSSAGSACCCRGRGRKAAWS